MTNNQLKARRIIIRSFHKKDKAFLLLYGIYKDAIDPGIEYNKFVEMYVSDNLLEIDFTCFYSKEERAGFSAAFFYKTYIEGKRAFIARSATGLTMNFQGKGLHNKYDLYLKFIRFAWKHPCTKLWVAAFVINAFIFRDLCKFVPAIFPMPGKQVPEHIQQVMDTILASGTHKADKLNPLSLEVQIQVKFNEVLLKRIFESRDPNIQWYLKANPRFLDKFGLLVVIDVSARNIFGTIYNLMVHSTKGKMAAGGKSVKACAKYLKQKSVTLVDALLKRRIL